MAKARQYYGWIDDVHVVTYSADNSHPIPSPVRAAITRVMPATGKPHLCAEGYDGKFGRTVLFTTHLQNEGTDGA